MKVILITLLTAVSSTSTDSSFGNFLLYAKLSSSARSERDAGKNHFPYQGALFWANTTDSPNAPYKFMCGCSLIAPQAALSAGHCKAYEYGSYQVRLGLFNQDTAEDVQIFNISLVDFIVHPNYTGGVTPNDIAVLKLDGPIEITPSVEIMELGDWEDCNAIDTAYVAGWGFLSPRDEFVPSRLQYAEFPRITNSQCVRAIERTGESADFLVDSMICTGSAGFAFFPRAVVCSGDSGGPLIRKATGRQIGVVQFVYSYCGFFNAPSGYTNVCSHKKSFINQHVDF